MQFYWLPPSWEEFVCWVRKKLKVHSVFTLVRQSMNELVDAICEDNDEIDNDENDADDDEGDEANGFHDEWLRRRRRRRRQVVPLNFF